MKTYHINTIELKEYIHKLAVGDKVFLSGTVYTARDAAHKRLFELIKEKKELPIKIEGSIIYYAGPTPTPSNLPIGSCGPTTSSRMDRYTPYLLDKGLLCTIGKGQRSSEVIDSIVKNKSVYLCAIGGAGALAAKCIDSCEVVAFDDLGCESIKELKFNNFPLIVAIDKNGCSIFNSVI